MASNHSDLNKLEFKGKWFIEPSSGRVKQFRGVNLGGNSKHPVGWSTTDSSTAFDLDDISFVGKPLPIDLAEEHCKRLKYWGLSFIRLLVPWEALEHKGPGKYDEEYISYLIELLTLFKKYGIRCFIDPHQDVWSRLSGGSGAPAWTFYIAGLDPRNFKATGAANTMFQNDPPEEYPIMSWPTNYGKLAAATMFTLFFGGEEFAPKCKINTESGIEENIQTFLQRCYCQAYQHLFSRFKMEGLLHNIVLGFDTMNEPSEGFIQTEDITRLPLLSLSSTRNGATPTVLQSMLLGSGNLCQVAKYSMGTFGFVQEGSITVDPKGTKAWLEEGVSILPNLQFPEWKEWQKDGKCIWAMHGVWDPSTKKALVSDYFFKNSVTKAKYDFLNEFWRPFVRKVTAALRTVDPDIIMFIEPPVNVKPPIFNSGEGDLLNRIVFAPHWYDGKTLVKLNFTWWTVDFLGVLRGKYWFIGSALKIGRHDVRKCFEEMIQLIMGEGIESLGETPMIVGESGIPFNMKNNPGFKDGDFTEQINALDATLNATEQAGSMCTVWNYCHDNNTLLGDLWNLEDLSIYSHDTIESTSETTSSKTFKLNRIPLDRGGRALEAAIRPYAMLTPGYPQKQLFTLAADSSSHAPYFEYSFKAFPSSHYLDTKVVGRCEIFLPPHHFPPGIPLNVEINDGQWELVYDELTLRGEGYSSFAVDEPVLQTLIWSFEFPLQGDELYQIKITHEGATFPLATSNFSFFC